MYCHQIAGWKVSVSHLSFDASKVNLAQCPFTSRQVMAVTPPSAAQRALDSPVLTELDAHNNTLGPGDAVSTKTASAYNSHVSILINKVSVCYKPGTSAPSRFRNQLGYVHRVCQGKSMEIRWNRYPAKHLVRIQPWFTTRT